MAEEECKNIKSTRERSGASLLLHHCLTQQIRSGGLLRMVVGRR
jgi:hypothetical protein